MSRVVNTWRSVVRVARSVLAACFFVSYAVGGIAMGLFLFPLFPIVLCGANGRRHMRSCVRASYKLFVWGARVTGLFRVDISPEDMRTLASLRGNVVAANHISLIDIVILMSILPDTTAVAKAAAGHNPFYSRVVSSVFLVNDDPLNVLSSAKELLSSGTNIVVFPEGTRTPIGVPRRLRRGAAQISIHSGADVTCVFIDSTPRVLMKGQPWWDVGAGTIRYTLRVAGKIVPPCVASGSASHSAAVSLTRTIEKRIWSDYYQHESADL